MDRNNLYHLSREKVNTNENEALNLNVMEFSDMISDATERDDVTQIMEASCVETSVSSSSTSSS